MEFQTPYWLPFRIATVLLCLMNHSRAFATYVNFESGHVRPLAISSNGDRLYVVNTPDNRIEILEPIPTGLRIVASVPVGLEPVALAIHDNGELWVVNHLSDSVSIVDTRLDPPRVVRTLLVGDEPRDIVFAGESRERAFVTTARRGQNFQFDPDLETPGIGRAAVWVFAVDSTGMTLGGEPDAVLTLFADTPRGLAVSPDGSRVYVAAFHSGNGTSIVSEAGVCDGGAVAGPCEVDGVTLPGGLPSPNENVDGVAGPETGLIVRRDAADGSWRDELDRDWSPAIRIDLPDEDVFVIDAQSSPPKLVGSYAGVGTIVYNLVANPVTGRVYATNTEARNEVRFEPRLRGHQHESRISILGDGSVTSRRLNPHLDHSRGNFSDSERAASIALPTGMAVRADGQVLYVAALGSGVIASIDIAAVEEGRYVPDARNHIHVAGGGPTGLVLDERRDRLYAMGRFDNRVSVIDMRTKRVLGSLPMHSPEPPEIVAGRRFLYDASFGSANGEAACASCHVFGDVDSLAWDLGDPNARVERNRIPLVHPDLPTEDFHPMKGPMTTQTFRGMADSGAMHWRGDRSGGGEVGGDPLDPRSAFREFNRSFVGLLGREEPLSETEFELFADFALSIAVPPNPIRALDNSLSADQDRAARVFLDRENCTSCHTFAPELRKFGTGGLSAFNPNPGTRQLFKVPHLRGMYQKVGYFGIFPIPRGAEGLPTGFLGDQVRGFGYLNDGAGILPPETAAFLLAFDSNFAPIVGQQVTLDADAVDELLARAELLRERAMADECDLVVKGTLDGVPRGWLYTNDNRMRSDRVNETAVDEAALRRLLGSRISDLTYTCFPPGMGWRAAVDRDGDGALDRDEIDAGSDPADAESLPNSIPPTPTPPPPPCVGDCDLDGMVTVDEIVRAVAIALGTSDSLSCASVDVNADGLVTVNELVRAAGYALSGCNQ